MSSCATGSSTSMSAIPARAQVRAVGAKAVRFDFARVVLLNQTFECVELRLTAAAAHLTLGDAQNLGRHAKRRLTIRALGQHA